MSGLLAHLIGRTVVAVDDSQDDCVMMLFDNDDLIRFQSEKGLLYRTDIPAMGNPGEASTFLRRLHGDAA